VNSWACWLAGLVAAMVAVAPSIASEVSKVRNGLRLTVGVRSEKILVREPAVLSLRFENTSDTPLLLGGPLQQLGHEHNIAVSIRHKSGLSYRHTHPMTNSVVDSRGSLRLLPGEDVEVIYVIGASFADFGDSRPEKGICRGKDAGNAWCWDFPLPGEYEVAVKYEAAAAAFRDTLWKGPIEASGARVHVMKPVTEIDKAALKAWDSAVEDMGRWRGGWTPDPNVRQSLAALVTGNLSSSRYAPFAQHLLAVSMSGSERWSEAEQQLSEIRAKYPDYVLLDEVLFDLAYVQQMMGHNTEATRTKIAAREMNPSNMRGKTYEELPHRW
jgi:hypothetical protein